MKKEQLLERLWDFRQNPLKSNKLHVVVALSRHGQMVRQVDGIGREAEGIRRPQMLEEEGKI